MQLKELWLDARLSALEEYLKIEKYISNIDDSEIRTIMRMRFLDLKKWEQIGNELKYDRTVVAKKCRKYINSNLPTKPIHK